MTLLEKVLRRPSRCATSQPAWPSTPPKFYALNLIKRGTTLEIVYSAGTMKFVVLDPSSAYKEVEVSEVSSNLKEPETGWLGHIAGAFFLGSSQGHFIVQGMDLGVFLLRPNETCDDDGHIMLFAVRELVVDGQRLF